MKPFTDHSILRILNLKNMESNNSLGHAQPFSPLSPSSTFSSSPTSSTSSSPASMCSFSPAFSFSPSFLYSPDEFHNDTNVFSFPPPEHLSISNYIQHLAGRSRAIKDMVLTNELVQIQKARAALEPPDWSKRQQGHRRGVPRTLYSKEKKALLLKKYNESHYITSEEMEQLAEKTGLSKHQVKIWFQNYRLKQRKRANFVDDSHKLSQLIGPSFSQN